MLIFEADPYPIEFYFVESRQEFNELCVRFAKTHRDRHWKKNKNDFTSSGIMVFGIYNNKFVAVIGVDLTEYPDRYHPKSIQGLTATLFHEISHAALEICQLIDYDPVVEQEPYCYLVGCLHSKIMDYIYPIQESLT